MSNGVWDNTKFAGNGINQPFFFCGISDFCTFQILWEVFLRAYFASVKRSRWSLYYISAEINTILHTFSLLHMAKTFCSTWLAPELFTPWTPCTHIRSAFAVQLH